MGSRPRDSHLSVMVSAGSGAGVCAAVPPVIPGVTPAPMQRVADATQVTADPTQPRANYSSPRHRTHKGRPSRFGRALPFKADPTQVPRALGLAGLF